MPRVETVRRGWSRLRAIFTKRSATQIQGKPEEKATEPELSLGRKLKYYRPRPKHESKPLDPLIQQWVASQISKHQGKIAKGQTKQVYRAAVRLFRRMTPESRSVTVAALKHFFADSYEIRATNGGLKAHMGNNVTLGLEAWHWPGTITTERVTGNFAQEEELWSRTGRSYGNYGDQPNYTIMVSGEPTPILESKVRRFRKALDKVPAFDPVSGLPWGFLRD
ncbi:TPA: hypothetical protein HA244_01265 [Candidatus Micrarchaeota archaeon]|nr:hypothetical protein [Candidatus Micrarchaeota archaeon]